MELEEAIERLKNLNDGYTFKACDVCSNYNETTLRCDKEKCEELIAIDTVIAELERLQKENEQYRAGDVWTANQVIKFEENAKKCYIHKGGIRKKIEEIKARMNDDCLALHEFQRIAQIDVLQELLEEE